jgi:hypothetical protein
MGHHPVHGKEGYGTVKKFHNYIVLDSLLDYFVEMQD